MPRLRVFSRAFLHFLSSLRIGMSSIQRLSSGKAAPTVTRDLIRERNSVFLEAHPSVTASQLYGHRIAAIFAGLGALFQRAATPNFSRSYALRIEHYAHLLRDEMVSDLLRGTS